MLPSLHLTENEERKIWVHRENWNHSGSKWHLIWEILINRKVIIYVLCWFSFYWFKKAIKSRTLKLDHIYLTQSWVSRRIWKPKKELICYIEVFKHKWLICPEIVFFVLNHCKKNPRNLIQVFLALLHIEHSPNFM